MICKNCHLYKTRKREVIGRGDMPADILFVGEAPGQNEDVRGIPFCGPAGELLRKGLASAQRLSGIKTIPSFYLTNVVRCRPTDMEGNNRMPTTEEAWACWPNLEQIYIDVNPKEVIFLGGTAESYCRKAWPHGVRLEHPASIARAGGTESPEYLRFIRNLADVFNRFKEGNYGL